MFPYSGSWFDSGCMSTSVSKGWTAENCGFSAVAFHSLVIDIFSCWRRLIPNVQSIQQIKEIPRSPFVFVVVVPCCVAVQSPQVLSWRRHLWLPQLHLVEKLPPVVSNHRCSVVQTAENCGVSAVAVLDGCRHPFHVANADTHGPDHSADHRVSKVAVLPWWSMFLLAGCADSSLLSVCRQSRLVVFSLTLRWLVLLVNLSLALCFLCCQVQDALPLWTRRTLHWQWHVQAGVRPLECAALLGSTADTCSASVYEDFWKNFSLSYVKGGLSDSEVDPRLSDCKLWSPQLQSIVGRRHPCHCAQAVSP